MLLMEEGPVNKYKYKNLAKRFSVLRLCLSNSQTRAMHAIVTLTTVITLLAHAPTETQSSEKHNTITAPRPKTYHTNSSHIAHLRGPWK